MFTGGARVPVAQVPPLAQLTKLHSCTPATKPPRWNPLQSVMFIAPQGDFTLARSLMGLPRQKGRHAGHWGHSLDFTCLFSQVQVIELQKWGHFVLSGANFTTA